MEDYKLKIDKNLLYEFLVADEEQVGNAHYSEVRKVIDIVLHKYYGAYKYMFEDLRCSVFMIILERRQGFDVDKDAYNYLFTQARNEAGNNIFRWTKERNLEDYTPEKSYDDISSIDSDLPESVIKYQHYLTGEADYSFKRVSRKDVCDLLVWLRIKEGKALTVPDFLVSTKLNIKILYKLLRDLIGNE